MPTSARTSLIEAVDNGTSFEDGVAGSRNWLRLSHAGLAAYPGLGKHPFQDGGCLRDDRSLDGGTLKDKVDESILTDATSLASDVEPPAP